MTISVDRNESLRLVNVVVDERYKLLFSSCSQHLFFFLCFLCFLCIVLFLRFSFAGREKGGRKKKKRITNFDRRWGEFLIN